MKSCLIIAGEKSGEEHANSFLPELIEKNSDTKFFGVGGDSMADQGVELLYHLNDFSSFGFSGVISKIPFYKKAMNLIVDQVIARGTKTAILIDFQTFNLKLAQRLKELGVQVLYYVAPQAWAWKEYRVKPLRESVHTLFTIIPFEKKWFLDRGVSQVESIDHPLLKNHPGILTENIASYQRSFEEMRKKPKLLFLPGSRSSEVKYMMPFFQELLAKLREEYDIEASIVCSSSVDQKYFDTFLGDYQKVYRHEDLELALKEADLSVATSGTITLSCALYGVPTVVGYKMSLFNWTIFEVFTDYKGFISLANIVLNKEIFPEYIQDSCSIYNVKRDLDRLLNDGEHFEKVNKMLLETPHTISGELKDVSGFMSQVINKSNL